MSRLVRSLFQSPPATALTRVQKSRTLPWTFSIRTLSSANPAVKSTNSAAIDDEPLSFFGNNNKSTSLRQVPPSAMVKQEASPLILGITRETYNVWERRAPLSPQHVETLLSRHDGALQIWVQRCSRRIFSNRDYESAGATLTDDLKDADVLLGVKRPADCSDLLHDKTYLFFGHVIKGQKENGDLLQTLLDRRIQLLDYERLVETPPPPATPIATTTAQETVKSTARERPPRRLVSFGRFAGLAGALDTLPALGRTLLRHANLSTPFLSLPPSLYHKTVEDAKQAVTTMGRELASVLEQQEQHTDPIVVAVTGQGGTVHKGAMEMMQLLPHEEVSVQDLPSLWSNKEHRGIYLVPVSLADIMVHTEEGRPFDRHHFQQFPGEYHSELDTRVAAYSQVLINCVYWDSRFPRLLTKERLKQLYEREQNRLALVSDISCDVGGSMEFLERTTTLEDPFFCYDPIRQRESPDGPLTVMGVDILPTELPFDSSQSFGEAVMGVVDDLIRARQGNPTAVQPGQVDLECLPAGVANACITLGGTLTPKYRYLKAMLQQARDETPVESMDLWLEGHLFDSGLINQIMDVIECKGCGVVFQECIFPPSPAGQHSGRGTKSSVVLRIAGNNHETLQLVESKVQALAQLIERAEAKVQQVGQRSSTRPYSVGKGSVTVSDDDPKPKKVVILGAGYVSRSTVDLLSRLVPSVSMTVVSDQEHEARAVASMSTTCEHQVLDVAASDATGALTKLIASADLVISLLPAPMHPPVAQLCLADTTHLVTASYESDALRALGQEAKDKNVVLLNEVGLDPGLDHMSACQLMDDIKDRGGTVTVFESVCGGLPEVADNPLSYKFSWNPRGVLAASQNDARYRRNGNVVTIDGRGLLASAVPFDSAACWPERSLEVLANRDSLKYERVYGIEPETLFRGTLRYTGFSDAMVFFQRLGLFEEDPIKAGMTWQELLSVCASKQGHDTGVLDFVKTCCGGNEAKTNEALEMLEWLELDADTPVSGSSVVEAFCKALQDKLTYRPGERDLVLMHHQIEAVFPDGKAERHSLSLEVLGDESFSAMSKTVGYTTAASAAWVLGSPETQGGLWLPTSADVYTPVLSTLQKEGIAFDHQTRVA